MTQIHWTAPSLMVASFIVGTLFALGHHIFYASLDGRHAATADENHDVLGMHISIQQINTAIGTAFAFLVRMCLLSSISVAYFQIFVWSIGNSGTKGTQLSHLDNMTSALHNLLSLVNFKTWWRRPWLWILAVVAWLIPLASIITPATLSVGIDFPPAMNMTVPNVDFLSLNLLAPMPADGTIASLKGTEPQFIYDYGGPSQTVRRITGAVAAQGSILPIAAPSPNSTWDLDFNGPSLHCDPVDSDFRHAVLDNMLNYTYAQDSVQSNCSYGPAYVAWTPDWIEGDQAMEKALPFNIGKLNSSSNAFNNNNKVVSNDGKVSVFLAIAPTLFNSTHDKKYQWFNPTLCQSEPGYKEALATYYDTSSVLRCDLHNSTYSTTFSFTDGVQNINIKNVDDIDTPMTTEDDIWVFFNSSDEADKTLQPQTCPWAIVDNCLPAPRLLLTLSYQAIMDAFTAFVSGTITKDEHGLIISSTSIINTVLAQAPELAFLQNPKRAQTNDTLESVQERAVMWQQQPFAGLLNAAAAPKSSLPFQQALEKLFQNITLSLMSAPDLQPNTSSTYHPNATLVHFSTRENIYLYSASKLWLAYGLAISATFLIVVFGIVAIVANDASFSNKFSTVLRMGRGAELTEEGGSGLKEGIKEEDFQGRNPKDRKSVV